MTSIIDIIGVLVCGLVAVAMGYLALDIAGVDVGCCLVIAMLHLVCRFRSLRGDERTE